MKYKIILLKKYTEKCNFWKTLIKDNNISNLNVEQVIKQYNGFEGNCYFYFSEEKFTKEVLSFINECKEIVKNEKKSEYLLLFLKLFQQEKFEYIKNNADFIGYDYGLIHDESNIYSSVFHEIIFGTVLDLVKYKEKLNNNLLFQSYRDVQEYLLLHNDLYKKGISVEYDEDMNIYEIYKIKI